MIDVGNAATNHPTTPEPGVESPQGPVRIGLLEPGQRLPLLVQPAHADVDAVRWAESRRDWISERLREHGGLLFRGFPIGGVGEFESLIKAISGELLEYKERSSPRHSVAGRIYTSTDYPPSQPIFLHNENSYQHTWPRRIFFYCAVPAEKGGETPIADTRRVYERVDPEVRERFARKGWMYVRNFGDGFGLTWQTVFQTEDRALVEEHCRHNGIEFEWKKGGGLRTRARRNAIARHPETGEMIWFNHATFFHVSTLPELIQEALLMQFEADDLPANSYYGDGSPIEPEVLDHLRACYDAETVRFAWEKDDLLLLDNMMVAHGRDPYAGDRKILVAMSHPTGWDDIDAGAA
ncbi:MAG TPA: TauD/TfdA family dioxygenase [Thermoanaerobaculia bacterium]|nr:TauD/TfdA family dioxygenase [Thermoanaerobaculia bacterium]